MTIKLPYRKSLVFIVLVGNRYLLVQRPGWKSNWWKFPQGGLTVKETEHDAIVRELFEELNISNFKILARSKYLYQYDWPKDVIIKNDKNWRGQKQSFYVIEYLGDESEIRAKESDEIDRYILVSREKIPSLINHRAKVFIGYKKVIEKIFKEFGYILK